MTDVLTKKELAELREALEEVEPSYATSRSRRLLATLDAANKEIAKLRRELAHNKGSHF
jgi:hypothetical protein